MSIHMSQPEVGIGSMGSATAQAHGQVSEMAAGFPGKSAAPSNSVMFTVGQSLEEVEREMIVRTMQATRGNRTRAAKLLGISVRTLYTKLLTIHMPGSEAATPAASAAASDRVA